MRKFVAITIPLILITVFVGTFILTTNTTISPPEPTNRIVITLPYVDDKSSITATIGQIIPEDAQMTEIKEIKSTAQPLELRYDSSGSIPIYPFDSNRIPDTKFYLKEAAKVAENMKQRWTQNNDKGSKTKKPFKFHVYQVPDKYIHGALKLVEEKWSTSFCNRHTKKSNYTNLDWRHAHSLFTADVMIAKYLQYHDSHTLDPNEADIFIIPLMTHVYNCAGVMIYATEVLSWITQFPYYKMYNGHDHYYFWWRWGMHFKSVERFWKRVVKYFPNANIISYDYLELMGRNNWQDFSLAIKPKHLTSQQWVVMPYPDFSPELSKPLPLSHLHLPRKIFFYFAGTSTIGGIRRWIKRACSEHNKPHGEMNVSSNLCYYEDFASSVIDAARLGIPSGYPSQMKNSLFCGHAAGDALSSRRPTSAVLAGCIPVLICDLCLYAFEDILDYSSFAVFIREDDVIGGKLMQILEEIPESTIRTLQQNLASVRHHFVYNITGPSVSEDALGTLINQLAVRGKLLRSYRRWWTYNHELPFDSNAYPLNPPPVKKYFKKGVSSPEEEKNFNNI